MNPYTKENNKILKHIHYNILGLKYERFNPRFYTFFNKEKILRDGIRLDNLIYRNLSALALFIANL